MMNLLRVICLSLLCLTLFTTSAAAECAWVVWELTQIPNPQNPKLATRIYNIMGANGTEDGCREMSKAFTKIKPIELGMYYCLPDTVDPRGPKGK